MYTIFNGICNRLGYKITLPALSILMLCSISATTYGQGWSYDFGTTTGAWYSGVSTSFLPYPTWGITRVSIGTGGGGSFHLDNQGLTDFGTDTEFRAQASANGNSDKVSIYNFAPSVAYYMHFLMRLDNSSDGSWYFATGDGSTFETDASASGSQMFANFQWKFADDDAITTKVRDNAALMNFTAFTFTQGVNYSMDLYMNNSSSTLYYDVAGTIYSVGAYNWDMWVNGVVAGDELPSGQLTEGANMDSWMFYSAKSVGNLATLYLDDIYLLPLDYLLPVSLQSFELNPALTHVDLNWETASENSTTFFDIERSADGNSFEKIGQVNAAGVSSQNIDYNFVDDAPLAGVNYYRLKINYADGSSQYSKILSTESEGNNHTLSIFPSPALNYINIASTSTIPDDCQVMIFDVAGNLVHQSAFKAEELNIEDLAKGVYVITLQGTSFQSSDYFIKE